MIHKCKYCDYESPYRPNMRRHEKSKHGAQEPSSHQHANANQSGIGVKSIPPNWFMAQHPYGYEYAEESRAPTKKSYGPDYHSAPTKIIIIICLLRTQKFLVQAYRLMTRFERSGGGVGENWRTPEEKPTNISPMKV